jgi:hypothetical protein
LSSNKDERSKTYKGGGSLDALTNKCSCCKKIKLLNEFGKESRKKSGFTKDCKECRNARNRTFYKKNIQKEQSRNHKNNRTLAGRYSKLKFKAKKRKLVCNITFEQFTKLVDNAICTYCKGPLPEVGYGLDRIDSSEGYVLDNVTPCCSVCNTLKGEDKISPGELKIVNVAFSICREPLTPLERENRILNAIREYNLEQEQQKLNQPTTVPTLKQNT